MAIKGRELGTRRARPCDRLPGRVTTSSRPSVRLAVSARPSQAKGLPTPSKQEIFCHKWATGLRLTAKGASVKHLYTPVGGGPLVLAFYEAFSTRYRAI